MFVDLHCHSTASDGLLPPTEVVRFAASRGLAAIALTDHDTLDGVAEAAAIGATMGIRVIGGCEFSVAAPWGEMHLLGYFLDPADEELAAFLQHARDGRSRRAETIVNKLHGQGIPITMAMVREEASGASIGRPHIARVMMNLGVVNDMQTAFDRWIGRGRPAYVDKELPTLREVADLVHARDGMISAAHLKMHGTETVLRSLMAEGLDAVEVRHPSHDADRIAILTNAALKLNLLRTGGSDWHGETSPVGTHSLLGDQRVPHHWLVALENARGGSRV